MKKATIKQTLDTENAPAYSVEEQEQLRVLRQMRDDEIDLSDIPELSNDQLAKAVRNPNYKPIKKSTTIRIDLEVLDWLKESGEGYQTRLNNILRLAMMRSKRVS